MTLEEVDVFDGKFFFEMMSAALRRNRVDGFRAPLFRIHRWNPIGGRTSREKLCYSV